MEEFSRIVITGAAGFIGSNIAKFLYEKEQTIVCIDDYSCGYESNLSWSKNCIERFKFYKIDIRDKELIDIIQKNDIIIHCAGIAPLPVNQENPFNSISNNVGGTANLLEIARIKGAKHVIFASTSAVYENNDVFPCCEKDEIKPTLIYSLGKKFCEELCVSFNELYGLPYTILRFFNVYGPNHDCLRKNPPFIAYLIREFMSDRQPLLHSNGDQKRDYIYIDDLLNFIDCLIQRLNVANKKTYNVSSGQNISVNDIVNIVKKYMKKETISPLFRNPLLLWEKNEILFSGEMKISTESVNHEVCKYSLGDNNLAFIDLNWKPCVNPKEGIEKTIDYTMDALSLVVKTPG
jgi:nucleoside-diphosphate-sugar epimerase